MTDIFDDNATSKEREDLAKTLLKFHMHKLRWIPENKRESYISLRHRSDYLGLFSNIAFVITLWVYFRAPVNTRRSAMRNMLLI